MNQNGFYLYQQMSGGALVGITLGWLFIIVFVVLCFICLYRSDKIHSLVLFRYSIIVFILAMMAPIITALFFNSFESPLLPSYLGSRNREMNWIAMIQTSVQPLLLAVSIAMLLFSVAPKYHRVPKPAEEPKPHPLDD